MSPNDAGGMANSVDPAPLGAVWSGSTLFAHTCLSENLGTIRYIHDDISIIIMGKLDHAICEQQKGQISLRICEVGSVALLFTAKVV